MKFNIYRSSLIILFIVCGAATGQTAYSPGDWQSWRDFRGARALDANAHELFVATAGGLLVYDFARDRWEDPAVMGYGSFSAVPVDDALLLIYDDQNNAVWVATRTKLLKWNRGMERWEIARENEWPLGERPVNIGLSGQSLYLETIPDHIFERLYLPGSPLPEPIWLPYVKSYVGPRLTGNLMTNMRPDDHDTPIRWRGLRSKLPLRDEEFGGAVLGQPPAGLPMVFAPEPFTWLADGTLLDAHNRTYPMTDWLLDRWGNFWSTQWGAGVIKVQLRGLRAEQVVVGPAGDDVRALLPLDNELWMGGANDGDFRGISVMMDFGDSWRIVEKRDNAQIRSTNVSDIVFADERVWVATTDGLLSYTPRKRVWKRYDVQDNLPAQQVTALTVHGQAVWIGTPDGLALLNTQTNAIERVTGNAFNLAGVTDLLATDSAIWVGTGMGLYRVDPGTYEISSPALDPGLINGPINGLAQFGAALWLVTPQGLMRRTADGQTKSWQSEVWLRAAIPTCISASDPYIWIGTDGGLFRFQPEREVWEHYTQRDGLVDNRVQVVREDRGDLWIGTAGGLTRYYYSRPGLPR
ncbi:MAG: hypothetical protein IPH10_05225 [bacterium]|nr:hypothetical protein [bacterium]